MADHSLALPLFRIVFKIFIDNDRDDKSTNSLFLSRDKY